MNDKCPISERNFLFTSDNRWPNFFLLVSKLTFRSTYPPPSSDSRLLKSLVSCQSRASQTFPGDLSSLYWQEVDLESALPFQTDTKFPTKKKIIHYARCVSYCKSWYITLFMHFIKDVSECYVILNFMADHLLEYSCLLLYIRFILVSH